MGLFKRLRLSSRRKNPVEPDVTSPRAEMQERTDRGQQLEKSTPLSAGGPAPSNPSDQTHQPQQKSELPVSPTAPTSIAALKQRLEDREQAHLLRLQQLAASLAQTNALNAHLERQLDRRGDNRPGAPPADGQDPSGTTTALAPRPPASSPAQDFEAGADPALTADRPPPAAAAAEAEARRRQDLAEQQRDELQLQLNRTGVELAALKRQLRLKDDELAKRDARLDYIQQRMCTLYHANLKAKGIILPATGEFIAVNGVDATDGPVDKNHIYSVE